MKVGTSAPGRPGQTDRYALRWPDELSAFALRQLIEHVVAEVFAVSRTALRTKTRGCAKVAFARQVAMYLAHVSCSISLSDVGRIFARDRTTVAHACRTIEDCRDDPDFDLTLEFLDCIVSHSLPRT